MPVNSDLTALELGPAADLEPELARYFDKCPREVGFVPNVLKAYAFDNAKLKAFVLMADDLMLGDSGLSKLEREMIAVAVSAANHCHYCLTAHGAAVRQRANDPEFGEQMAQNYRVCDLSPRQKAMLDFAVRLTEAPDKIEVGIGSDCGRRVSGIARSGTSRRWPPFITCRTAWLRPSTCARTGNIIIACGLRWPLRRRR
jgi:uncharacterized peroxidase-related enzyme